MTGSSQIYRVVVLKRRMADGVIGMEEGVGQIKTLEGSKGAVKEKGQTKHMMFQAIHDMTFYILPRIWCLMIGREE